MDRKIKVLYIVSTLRRCGPSNQLFNIVSNLDQTVFTSKILTLSNESDDSLKSKFVEAGIDVETLGLGRISGIFKGYGKLLDVVRRFQPNVVHTQGIRADRYAVRLKSLGIKTVATIRCIPSEDYVMKYGRLLGTSMAKDHLASLRRLDQVAAVSKAINKALVNCGLSTMTIQNGVDIIKYTEASPSEKKGLRDMLGLPQDKLILISVGHLSNRKDPLTIIKAFLESSNREKFHLIFVGDGELRQECLELIKDDIDIQLIGRVPNVDEYLKASNIFISASLSEGLPNTVLESLACGIPTVLSGIPQHTEIFGTQVDEYKFFNVKDVLALKRIIESIPLEITHATTVRKIAEDYFDAKKMSYQYQDIYQRLLS